MSLARFRAFIGRLHLSVWLGTPVAIGLVGYIIAPSKYSDIYEAAQKAKYHKASGILYSPDLRKRTLALDTKGGMLSVRCDMGISHAYCAKKDRLPYAANITYFMYKGRYPVIGSIATHSGHLVVSHSERTQQLKHEAEFNQTMTPLRMFSVFYAFALICSVARFSLKRLSRADVKLDLGASYD